MDGGDNYNAAMAKGLQLNYRRQASFALFTTNKTYVLIIYFLN